MIYFSFSINLINEIQEKINRIKKFQEKIFNINDQNKESLPSIYIENKDARVSWFTGIEKLIFIWSLNILLVQKYLSSQEWWLNNITSNSTELKESDVLIYIEEYLIASRLNVTFMSIVLLEEMLYSILKKILPNGELPAKKLGGKLKQFFGENNIPSVFILHQEMRNLTHLNGVFDSSRQKKEIEFGGTKYSFLPGELSPIIDGEKIDHDKLLIDILNEEIDQLHLRCSEIDIAKSESIRRIGK